MHLATKINMRRNTLRYCALRGLQRGKTMARAKKIVTEYIKMWPREVYDIKHGRGPLPSLKHALHQKTGVYVLYRDEKPYYIGQAKGSLWRRIRNHALNPNAKYYNHWKYFSVFVIPDKRHISEIEGVLIAALGESVANSARMRIKRIRLPRDAKNILARENIIRA